MLYLQKRVAQTSLEPALRGPYLVLVMRLAMPKSIILR